MRVLELALFLLLLAEPSGRLIFNSTLAFSTSFSIPLYTLLIWFAAAVQSSKEKPRWQLVPLYLLALAASLPSSLHRTSHRHLVINLFYIAFIFQSSPCSRVLLCCRVGRSCFLESPTDLNSILFTRNLDKNVASESFDAFLN